MSWRLWLFASAMRVENSLPIAAIRKGRIAEKPSCYRHYSNICCIRELPPAIEQAASNESMRIHPPPVHRPLRWGYSACFLDKNGP